MTKKKIVWVAISIPLILLIIAALQGIYKAQNMQNDPLNLGLEYPKSLIGKPTPFDKWMEWGSPETLDGTNNEYWGIYLPNANLTLITSKDSQIVKYASFSKVDVVDKIEELEKSN
ncbi:hypothetical protein [Muricauda sp. MAR_2010_75]|uniref:hypothetical protein n=1 Tax=Allomuricauda sp. MAR_2010_75 TaxID=1250232 RepID=UPI00056BABBE|nr:hypothetical protein [Muricauda sp. MAR_2010_75]